MLKVFKEWFDREKKDELSENGVSIQTEESPADIDKPSIRYDLDTDTFMGRITVWSTGECQLEIVEIESENSIYDVYLELVQNDNFSVRLNEFFEKITATPPPHITR